jgi:hypothetical protein
MHSVEDKILRRIRAKPSGWVFTPTDFRDFGSQDSVKKALKNICDRGRIRRLARGIYDNPIEHPSLGILAPKPEKIVHAVATQEHRKVQPSGAYAANLLGLSTQVPARIVFLTDGPDKQIKVGKQTIQLKHCSPRLMAGAGTFTGLFIQALRYLGKKKIGNRKTALLTERLNDQQKRQLRKDIKMAPAWIGDVIRKITVQAD